MNVTIVDRLPETVKQARLNFIDCDVHPYLKSPTDLDPFLSERWRRHRQTNGQRSRSQFVGAPNYPRMSPGVGMRVDAWPEDGSHPGSDLNLMREQLLDAFGVMYGMMMPLLGRGGDELWSSEPRCALQSMTGRPRCGAIWSRG